MDESLKKHREFLLAATQKAQEEFDKNVLWLSSGALGVSFASLKDLRRIQVISATVQLILDTKTQMIYGSTNADAAPEFVIQVSGVASLKATDFVL